MGLPVFVGHPLGWLDGIPLTLGLSDGIELVGLILGCELGDVETLGLADGADDGDVAVDGPGCGHDTPVLPGLEVVVELPFGLGDVNSPSDLQRDSVVLGPLGAFGNAAWRRSGNMGTRRCADRRGRTRRTPFRKMFVGRGCERKPG